MTKRIGLEKSKPRFGALCAALLMLAASCSIEPPEPNTFYQWEETGGAAAPGDILRIEPYPGAPKGATAWRVLYQSTDLQGKPKAVSGVVIAPEGKPATANRPVIAWAHPTTGVATRCAPSLASNFYTRTEGLQAFLDRGFVVAATDYPGLGTSGAHPYLVGVSEARSVLDSVRAAMKIEEAGAAPRFVVWGHSQGGHAAFFTGQLAADYAPDLELAGVAAAAPATDLATLLHDDINGKAGKVLTAFALWSWNRVHDAPLDPLISSETKKAVDNVSADCLESGLQGLLIGRAERPLNENFFNADITQTEPWKTLLARNTPPPASPGAPLFIAQGAADKLVRPQVTVDYAKALCRNGASVRLDWIEGAGHLESGPKSVEKVAQWMTARFQGAAPESDCDRILSGALPGQDE